MLNVLTAGAVALSALAVVPGVAAADTPPVPAAGAVQVTVASAAGSGCPSRHAEAALNAANTDLMLDYEPFAALATPGASPTDARRNCQVSLTVAVPDGYTFAIQRTTHEGYANLADGATGTQRTSWYWQGTSQTGSLSHVYGGPYGGSFRATDELGVAALVWRPCGSTRNLNINAEVVVNAGSSAPAAMNFMAIGIGDESAYHLVWQRCS
jgi:hypothetical protein